MATNGTDVDSKQWDNFWVDALDSVFVQFDEEIEPHNVFTIQHNYIDALFGGAENCTHFVGITLPRSSTG